MTELRSQLLSVILFPVFLITGWVTLHLVLRSGPITEPYMISHRGAAAHAPENTLAGISEAADRGAQFVEVDVQRSADGVLVLMHDTTVDRTTSGRGAVASLSWDDLRGLDAGSHFSEVFSDESIPKLACALDLASQLGVHLVLEAKHPHLYPGIERQIADRIDCAGMADRVIVVSFDHGWLEHFQAIAPGLPLGRLCLWMGSTNDAVEVALADVYWLSAILDPTLVWRAHRRGCQVVVWTVNEPRVMKLLLWLGVDGIATDRPSAWGEAMDRG